MIIKRLYNSKLKRSFIFLLITFFLIFMVILSKNYCQYQTDIIYHDTKINVLLNKEIYYNLDSVKNIKNYITTVEVTINNEKVLLSPLKDNYLKEDEVIVSGLNIDKNTVLPLKYNNKDYLLKVKELKEGNEKIIYINEKEFFDMNSNRDYFSTTITIDKYSLALKTIESLKDMGYKKDITFLSHEEEVNINFNKIIMVLNYLLIILEVTLVIGIIIMIKNIFLDKNLNFMYEFLGFNNWQINMIFIIKVICLFGIPFILNYVLYLFLNFFIK